MRSCLLLCLCAGLLTMIVASGCSSRDLQAPASIDTAGKIAPRLAAAARQLEQGTAKPPLTGLVRSDAQGNIQVYVHVTDTSHAHLTTLGQRGLTNMLASPALGIVQGWVKPADLAGLAALTFVTRITPPQYAVPR